MDVYVCPQCIKKHNLYFECEETVETVGKYISGECDDGTLSLTCGVKGCNNGNSFDGWLDINECRLKESD